MFQKKPVSKYSTFQNIWFMIKLACTSQEKKVLVISFFIALLTIIQNLLNLYVSPVILSAIENHVSIQKLLFTIVIFVLMMMLVSAALAYANQNVICGRISVRCEIVNLLNKKASTTSYPNIDDMKFKKLLTKSYEYTDNNDQATEAIWNTLTVLLKMCIRDSSRGDSGALYLQSATAGVMPIRGLYPVELPSISGVDVWVLRNRNL